jgi:hypothetical protein
MNKKGQFYIIISLVLSLVLFGLIYKTNYIEEAVLSESFNGVSQNYISEGTKLVNDALEERDDNIKSQIEGFTTIYLEYAKQRDPNLGLLYVYSEEGMVNVVNSLPNSIEFDSENLIGGEQEIIQGITLEIGGKKFVHQVPIKGANFGDDWTNTEFISSGPFSLGVGGIIHKFNSDEVFKVIIRTNASNYVVQQNIN